MEIKPSVTRTITAHLQKLRKASGLTQAQVAGRIRCSQAHVSHMENGPAVPPIWELERFASLYGVHLLEFFGCDRSVTELMNRVKSLEPNLRAAVVEAAHAQATSMEAIIAACDGRTTAFMKRPA